MFDRSVQTVRRGDRLTLVNDSRLVHIVGPGRGGTVVSAADGVPMSGLNLMETDSAFTTEPWEKPGTYHLTCSVHPKMTLEVVVVG